MRLPPTPALALRLRARQVIATTALCWRLPTGFDVPPPRPHFKRSHPHRVSNRLSLQGFAL